jgi:hypothetical protein
MYVDIAPLLTNNPLLGRLDYDKTSSLDIKSYYDPNFSTTEEEDETTVKMKANLNALIGRNIELQEWSKEFGSSSRILDESRTGEDKSVVSTY